jgi:Ca-activated chloride channel family protein
VGIRLVKQLPDISATTGNPHIRGVQDSPVGTTSTYFHLVRTDSFEESDVEVVPAANLRLCSVRLQNRWFGLLLQSPTYMKINASLDFTVILANRAQPVHFALQLEAATLNQTRPRPAAFCVVLDRSGSMNGPPLDKAKQAAKLAARNLRPEDNFSLVIFDTEAQVLIPSQVAANKDALLRAIDGIRTGGNTNLTGGWSLGRDELKKTPDNVSRRLLLLSDGKLNTGIVEPEAVKRVVAAGLESHGIRTSCLGFGDDYYEDLMTALAQATTGQFYDADAPEKLPAIFESELEGLQKITVQNLRVRLRPLDFCDALAPLGSYQAIARPDRWTEYFIGDLMSGENRVICFTVGVLPLPSVEGKPVVSLEGERLLEFELLYDEITESEIISRTHNQIVRIQATQNEDEVKRKDEVIPWVALQRAGQVLDQLTRLMDAGDIAAATASIQNAINDLKRYGSGAPVAEAIQQLEASLNGLARWSLRERKTSKYLSHSYRRMSSSEHWSGSTPPPSFKQPPPTQPSQPPTQSGNEPPNPPTPPLA